MSAIMAHQLSLVPVVGHGYIAIWTFGYVSTLLAPRYGGIAATVVEDYSLTTTAYGLGQFKAVLSAKSTLNLAL